jgi:TolB protein
MRTSFALIPVLLILAWGSVGDLRSQVTGLTVGPGGEKYPIAISPFKNLAGVPDQERLSETLAEVIAKDLDLTGWFKILDRDAHIENPQKAGITGESIDFRSWSVIGALGLVKGGITIDRDQVTVEARLFDVVEGRQLVGKQYVGSARELARIGHKFADEIIRQFTGQPGAFDTRIAFIAARNRFKELFVMNLDGSDVIQLTQNRTINLSPSWTPDGRSVVYTSYKELNPDLFQIEVGSRRERRLSGRAGLNLGGKWSPDGRLLAVALERDGNADIYLLNPEGGVVRRLTDHRDIDISPAWSPNGQRIAFVSGRTGSPQIYLMDVGGGSPKRLTYAGNYNTSPAWSPTGRFIAYTGRAGGGFDIYTVDVATGAVTRLTHGQGRNEDPSWSPDGRFLIFASTRDGKSALYVMQSGGGHVKRLTSKEWDATHPAWSTRRTD